MTRAEYFHLKKLGLGGGLSPGALAAPALQHPLRKLRAQNSPLLNGLVAYYKFDDGSGSSLADSSGKGNTGAWHGSLGSQWGSGIINGAGSFDGSTNYVNLGAKAGLQVEDGANPFTISAWAYTTSTTTTPARYECIVNKVGYDLQLLIDTQLQGVSNRLGIGLFVYDSSPGFHSAFDTTPISSHTWYHAATTYDGTTATLYVNGANVASTGAIGPLYAYGPQTYIGAAVSGTTNFMTGLVDETGIWNRCLSAGEIATLYNSGNGLAYPF